MLRFLSAGLEWRWCSRCGWEGLGRRGPGPSQLPPPAHPGTAFRWGDPNVEEVPTFFWRSEAPDTVGDALKDAPPDLAVGLDWQADQEQTPPEPPGFYFHPPDGLSEQADDEQTPRESPGFHFRPPGQQQPTQFQWGPNDRRKPPPRPNDWQTGEDPTASEPPGFYFRPPGKRRQTPFQWAPGDRRGPRDRRRPPPRPRQARTSRPWYLSWLVAKDPPGFEWGAHED